MASKTDEKHPVSGLDAARILFVGGGAMGGAIARGLVESGAAPAAHVLVADPDASKRAEFEALGCATFADAAAALAERPDVVVLAVKPQILPAVVAGFGSTAADALVISIAAGITLETLQTLFGEGQRVVRVMPNLGAQVGKSATALSAGTWATASDVALATALMGAVGAVFELREDQLDAAGAVAGCAPAYMALMVDALTRAGIEVGLPAAVARALVLETMESTAVMLADSGQHPRAFMERVMSPGGTTVAACHAMEPLLEEACWQAVDAAMVRTAELAG